MARVASACEAAAISSLDADWLSEAEAMVYMCAAVVCEMASASPAAWTISSAP